MHPALVRPSSSGLDRQDSKRFHKNDPIVHGSENADRTRIDVRDTRGAAIAMMRPAFAAAFAIMLTMLVFGGSGGSYSSIQPASAQASTLGWTRSDIWMPSYDPNTLLDPQGIAAAPNGRFFVADKGHDRIVLVDSLGQIEMSIGGQRGEAPNEFKAPRDVAVDHHAQSTLRCR